MGREVQFYHVSIWKWFKLANPKFVHAALAVPSLVCVYVCVCAQSCPTLCHPMDCSLLGCSVHAIFQARILEWVISSSMRSSWPRDQPGISCIGSGIITETPGKPVSSHGNHNKCSCLQLFPLPCLLTDTGVSPCGPHGMACLLSWKLWATNYLFNGNCFPIYLPYHS